MGKSQSEGFVKSVVACLERERRRQGMSHERLAHLAGIHRSTVSRTERGLMNPTLYVIHAMATALGMEMTQVLAQLPARRGISK